MKNLKTINELNNMYVEDDDYREGWAKNYTGYPHEKDKVVRADKKAAHIKDEDWEERHRQGGLIWRSFRKEIPLTGSDIVIVKKEKINITNITFAKVLDENTLSLHGKDYDMEDAISFGYLWVNKKEFLIHNQLD